MDEKLKKLAIIPVLGTSILLIYLYILCLKDKISKKKFFKSFLVCGIVFAICWYMVMMIVYIISEKWIHFDFNTIGIIIIIIIGGYIGNAFAFKYFDEKWDYLSYDSVGDGKLFSNVNKKKRILIGSFLAIVVIILTVATIIMLK